MNAASPATGHIIGKVGADAEYFTFIILSLYTQSSYTLSPAVVFIILLHILKLTDFELQKLAIKVFSDVLLSPALINLIMAFVVVCSSEPVS